MTRTEQPSKSPGDQLADQVILTAVAFAPAVLARGVDREDAKRQEVVVMSMRDSVRYRNDALDWHVSLLNRLQKGAEAHIIASIGRDPNALHDTLHRSAAEQQFAFDDVVFNAVALLDYVGNMVAFGLYGEPHQKGKWKKVQRFARSPEYEAEHGRGGKRISGSDLGAAIRRIDSELFARLMDYRSELLHYQTGRAKGGARLKFQRNEAGTMDATSEVGITAPVEFSKWCSVPGYAGHPVPIAQAAKWVCEETQRSARLILKELEREWRREAGRDPDGTDRVIQIL